MAWRGLTKPPWEAIRLHLPEPKVSPRGGRPRIEDRRWFEGILWILWTGAPWSELPQRYGSPSTCWRRLKDWEETGVLLTLWRAFLAQLSDRQKLRWDECFVDGSFVPANKGGPKGGTTKRGQGTQWMVLVDGAGTPLGAVPGGGVPGGGHAPRADPRHGRGRPPGEAWTPAHTPEAPDGGSGR